MRFGITMCLACVTALWCGPVGAQQADEILAAMREMTVSQGERDVTGSIRTNHSRDKVPFSLSVRGETLCYQYKQDGAWKRFDVRIREKGAELAVVEGGKARVLAPAGYTQAIPGTDLCYEDLSLRFLYWKDGRVLEQRERIKGRECYVIELRNPKPAVGQFATVRLWVDCENGTAWQTDGYGSDGKLRKRFTITSVKKLADGTWFFKEMKVEIRDPKNPDRTRALNYLSVDNLPAQ